MIKYAEYEMFSNYSRVKQAHPIVGAIASQLEKLPTPVQHMIIAILARTGDPEPEKPGESRQETPGAQFATLGWLPLLTLTSAWGVLMVTYAYNTARFLDTDGFLNIDVHTFFWLGLLLIFVPCLVRLISPSASRCERIGLLCVLGVCLYLVKVTYSPLYFAPYDEFLHWHTANNIISTDHLFGANPLLPVSPDYPGLEIVTDALCSLSGLSIFVVGIILICFARLLMILSLFLMSERVMKSARVASIVTILYMTNPHFIFFDAAFIYESLALPLATFMLFTLVYYDGLSGERYSLSLTAWLTLAAVVVTHHATEFFFTSFLILWTMIYTILRIAPLRQSNLLQTTILAVFLVVAYTTLVAQPVIAYFSLFAGSTSNGLVHILTGSGHARQLFTDYGGEPTPLWERVMSFSSVAIILLSLPCGLLCLWQRYRSNTLACLSGLLSLCYPLAQAFRLTDNGGEISDRVTTFLFIPIAFVIAICITQLWPIRWLNGKQTLLICTVVTVLYLGGTVLGAGPPWALLPGPYLVGADQRSVDPESIEVATWTYSHLGPDNRFATDRINTLLMDTYGQQRLITSPEDKIEVAPVFFSPSLGPGELAILREARIRYIVVDRRFAYSLPHLGFYFDPSEPGAFGHRVPIDQRALAKFNTIPQINQVFDCGDIAIYDVGGLADAS